MFRDISNIDKVDEKTDAKRSIFTTLEYLIWSWNTISGVWWCKELFKQKRFTVVFVCWISHEFKNESKLGVLISWYPLYLVF